jgi:hypothetical protein
MEHQNYCNALDLLTPKHNGNVCKDYIRSTSEETKLRALSLFLIRSIVKRHRGTLSIDLASDTINIEVPEEAQVACAQEIEEQVGGMCG